MLHEWLDEVRAVPSRLQKHGQRLIKDLSEAPSRIADQGETARTWAKERVEKVVENGESTLQNANMAAIEGARSLLEATTLPESVSEQATQVVERWESSLVAPPLANYDELGVRPILRQLHELDDLELTRLERYETKHKARKTLLDAIRREADRRAARD